MTTKSERDREWMKQALACGESALKRSEIPVGCVFVTADGMSILAQGSNMTNVTRNGTTHAEMNAINEAIANGVESSKFRNAELYVTCEPCIMCAAALSRLGVRRVVFGCANERFGGNGSILNVHKDAETLADYHAYEVESGVMGEEAIAMFQRFYVTENKRAPEGKRKRKKGEVEENTR